jgi:hypothetical protein
MLQRLVLLLFLIGLSSTVSAEQSFEDRIPKELLTRKDRSFFTLTVENDLFGAGTDRNYTSGVRLSYYDAGEGASNIVRRLEDYLGFYETNETTNTYYSIGQNLYTPAVITTRTPDPNDRPYAAFLYGSIGSSTVSGDHIDDIELTLGVVGPWALGKETQKFVHEQINSDDPLGWDHQLQNEPGLMIAFQRTWPEAFAAQMDPFYLRVAPHLGATIGNIYSYAAFGTTLQLVPTHAIWQAPPQRVRPAIPGSGYFAVPEDRFAWSLFAGFEARSMFRNIFLDGNSFRDSPSVDRDIAVLDANLGLSTTYGPMQIAYTLNWRSREFKDQDKNALFGSISLGYRF